MSAVCGVTGKLPRHHRLHNSSLVGSVKPFPHRLIHHNWATCALTPTAKTASQQAFILDLDCLVDLAPLLVAAGFDAARSLFGADLMVGSASLYQRSTRAALHRLGQPYEAALLLRVLAEEGVVGARSTSGGRSGPVVGRAVRTTGSRPLLAAEIAENWPVLLEACIARWAHQKRLPLQPLWTAAHTPQQQNSLKASAGAAPATVVTTSVSPSGGPPTKLTATAARQRFLEDVDEAYHRALQNLCAEGGITAAECLSQLQPFPAASAAVQASTLPVHIVSPLPLRLTRQVLELCGLEHHSDRVIALARCAHSRLDRDQDMEEQTTTTSSVSSDDSCSSDGFGSGANDGGLSQALALCQRDGSSPSGAAPTSVHCITGSLTRLQSWHSYLEHLRVLHGMHDSDTAHHLMDSTTESRTPVEGGGGASIGAPPTTNEGFGTVPASGVAKPEGFKEAGPKLYFAEFAGACASTKAQALSCPGVQLLGFYDLAELMGVADNRIVLDGIDWK